MPEIPTSSPFATANIEAEDLEALIASGLEACTENGVVNYSEIDTPIGYARGWLIVRHAWLSLHNPSSLIDWSAVEAKALNTKTKREEAATDRAKYEYWVVAPVISELRHADLSWGEIMCRTEMSEGRVRKAFRMINGQKDLGDRIGRGGRFAYDDPTLYLEHRKREGAHIPVDYKGRPKPEDLLNFKKDEEVQAKSA